MIDALSVLATTATSFSGQPAVPTRSPGAAGFAEALDNAVRQMSDRLHSAEDISVKALTGEASARETVDVVLAAERTLQVAVAVRDKAVSAWLEISRMAI